MELGVNFIFSIQILVLVVIELITPCFHEKQIPIFTNFLNNGVCWKTNTANKKKETDFSEKKCNLGLVFRENMW